jgi:hypothetical protein
MNQNEKIRKLNDDLRKHNRGGQIIVTAGVAMQDETTIKEIIQKVKNTDDFTPDNDPYQEHDFGVILHHNIKYFWKIDYYDLSMIMLSEDPANPNITRRVLTILLASEY